MRRLLVFGVLAFGVLPAVGDDWTQWRGPNRTDISREKGLLKTWPEGGPKRLWLNKNVGLGYSGFSVVDGTLYTMGARDESTYLLAIDVQDGSEKWAKEVGSKLANNWGGGPRSTPTVDGEHVYALAGRGELVCAKRADGSIVWQANMSDFGGRVPGWGYCESVLIDGDKCVCTPGGRQGAIVALHKKTGKRIWQSTDFTEGAQYSSIVVAEHNGKRQYIQLTMKKVVGLDAETGDVLWTSGWPGRTAVIPTPIFKDGYVFVTSGYGAGCKLLKLEEGNKVTEVYAERSMTNHHGGVILVGEHLYGYSDRGGWTCMEFKTGKVVWSERRALGKGCLTCADGMLYLLDERNGTAVLIEASPEGWNPKGRFTLEPQSERRSSRGKIWTHPVIAEGKLFLRDQELLSCYDVKAK